MIKSARRFLTIKENFDTVKVYIHGCNPDNGFVPQEIMDELVLKIIKHLRNPTLRNVKKFLPLVVASYYKLQKMELKKKSL